MAGFGSAWALTLCLCLPLAAAQSKSARPTALANDFLTRTQSLIEAPERDRITNQTWRRLVREHVDYLQSFDRELAAAELDPALSDEHARAERAFLRSAAALQLRRLTEPPSRPVGKYLGREEYAWRIKHDLRIDESPEELRELGLSLGRRIKSRMEEIASRLAPARDLAEVMSELKQDHPADDKQLFHGYQRHMQRAALFVREMKLLAFPPGLNVRVTATSDDNLDSVPIAAFLSHQNKVLLTPNRDPSRRWSAHYHALIPSLVVHEAVPGHALHYLAQAQADPSAPPVSVEDWMEPDPGRPLSYWERLSWPMTWFESHAMDMSIEGYALYVEELMREHGFFTPKEELAQLGLQLWRAWRLALEPALHLGMIDENKAAALLVEEAFVPPEVADGDVLQYLRHPTRAATYMMGRMQLERIKERCRKVAGDAFRESPFHAAFFRFGFMPPAFIADAMASEFAAHPLGRP